MEGCPPREVGGSMGSRRSERAERSTTPTQRWLHDAMLVGHDLSAQLGFACRAPPAPGSVIERGPGLH
eukprot:15463132-Alexandrium_andersonii.AAC.1